MYSATSYLACARASDMGRIVPHTGRDANGRSNFPKHHWIPAKLLGSRPSKPYLLFKWSSQASASPYVGAQVITDFPHSMRTTLCISPVSSSSRWPAFQLG